MKHIIEVVSLCKQTRNYFIYRTFLAKKRMEVQALQTRRVPLYRIFRIMVLDDDISDRSPAMGSEKTASSSDESNILYKPSESDMLFYYERLLPFRHIYQWLSHSPKPTKDFTMREFAYEYRSGAYQRYNSFASLDEFKKSVVNANPTRFEIGAVYSVDPKERKNLPKQAMKAVSKELVFDIDLTDYDGIRTCCQGTDICKKCWRFIQVGAKVIELALRDDFGFKNLIWVFSGRRGAHCWISDSRARQMDETTRKSIVEYMDVLGAKQPKFSGVNKKILSIKKPYHPHVERSLSIFVKAFDSVILLEQDPWLTDSNSEVQEKAWEQVEVLLSFLPENALQNQLRTLWKGKTGTSTSKAKWEDINKVASKVLKSATQIAALNEAKKDIVIYYMYPRLDIEVSRQVIHLLKSPFCIHPGTGNVCVPFDPLRNILEVAEDDAYGFNPMNAPNLRKIQRELEFFETTNVSSAMNDTNDARSHKLAEYEKTCLKPYIEFFAKFVNDLLKEELKSSGSGKRPLDENGVDF